LQLRLQVGIGTTEQGITLSCLCFGEDALTPQH